MGEVTLWKHQQSTVDWMDQVRKGLVLQEPGLGKTLSALQYIISNNLKALILCPKTLMDAAWQSDIETFFPEFMDYNLAFASNREKAVKAQPQILIANFEAVNWFAKKKSKHSRILPNMRYLEDYDICIVDECVAFKNHSAQRSKSMRVVSRAFKQIYFMTGTPITKSVQDMWNICFMVDRGERLGQTLSGFRFNYCDSLPVPGAPLGVMKHVDKPGAALKLSETIADISICYTRDEVMDLPPNQEAFIGHSLSPKSRKAYTEMVRHSITKMESGDMLVGINKAVARNKLLQICTGSVYGNDGESIEVCTERAELVAELCEEREHTVVFFLYRHQRDSYIQQLEKKGLSYVYIDGSVNEKHRGGIVKEFQDGKYRVILLHPQTGSHGVTLTRATTTIFASPPGDRAEWLKQGRARIWRGGQDKKTETIYIYAKDTLEKKVYSAIQTNASVDDAFLGYIKDLT